jgi:hypothetical protein
MYTYYQRRCCRRTRSLTVAERHAWRRPQSDASQVKLCSTDRFAVCIQDGVLDAMEGRGRECTCDSEGLGVAVWVDLVQRSISQYAAD